MEAFTKIPDAEHFYLTGGTALAEFYYGHRRSYDLDLFTNVRDMVIPFSRQLEAVFKERGLVLVPQRRFSSFAEFVCQAGKEQIRLHLAYDTPYRFGPPHRTGLGVFVNDYEDLVTDKLLAFFGRWTHRDAVDLYFILQDEDFKALTEKAKEKDPGFDLYWLSKAMKEVEQFPDDMTRWDVDMVRPIDARDLKSAFGTLAQTTLQDLLRPDDDERRKR